MYKDNKLDMHTVDRVDENITKIGNLFPNCITEKIDDSGNLVKAIDFDLLRQELSTVVVDGSKERYQFTWPDKKTSMLLANSPISATLRPCREESVKFDATENLYIEGDNLDFLKILQETYLGKVKMIYIDPPYNTGNDFVYEDDFDIDAESYKVISGDYDDQENRLVKNTDSNGRFHTDWLNMMYPRLKLARDLLKDDGVLFISIDDGEVKNLRNVCDEIFGEVGFVACMVWQRIHSTKNDAKYFSENHEYILCYAKVIDRIKVGLLPRSEEMNDRYKNPDNDPRGVWQSGDLVASGERSNGHFIVKSQTTGKEFDVPLGKHWVYSEENLQKFVLDNQIWFGSDGNSFPRKKRFLSEVQDGRTPNTLWLSDEVGHNQSATRELLQIFDNIKLFDFPKPVELIKRCVHLFSTKEDLILDFFSGSATTAHAVMQLNAEDGGNRKFIMVQIPETTDESSEAFKAGYKNICEIGKERIRRAGKRIKEEAGLNGQNLDIGFRVLKLDSSNMKNVYYSPEAYVNDPTLFDQVHDNIKEDRTEEDLLFQIMLDLGVLLSSKIEVQTIAGKKVYSVMDNYLIACFDRDVTDELVTEIAKKKPYYAVLRDSSFGDDAVAANFEQIFATYSPETIKKVL